MKTNLVVAVWIALFLWSCNSEEKKENSAQSIDTIPPVIMLRGAKIDTVCLNITYQDPGTQTTGELDENGRYLWIPVKTTGTVNTSVPGVYLLNYTAEDARGNKAATITRSVQVVDNSADFLTGLYNAVCSCTASVKGSANTTITTDTYMAAVKPDARNRNFDLTMLRIGPEYVVPVTSLSGNTIGVFYFSPDYQMISATGTLSATKDAFTIETTFYRYYPPVTYKCRNVYSKPG